MSSPRLGLGRLRACLLALALLGGSPTPLGAAAPKASWVEVRSPHFIAYSDAGEGEARRTLEAFEAMRRVFTALLPGLKVDLHKPVVVIVTEDEISMKAFVPDQFAGKDPKRSSGLYLQGRERDHAIVRLDAHHQDNQPFAVMFHEYTHAIVHNNFTGLPTWLDEGIAEFYGATEIRSSHVYLGRVPVHHVATLRQGRMPLADLLRVTRTSPAYMEGSKTGVFYAQSWALVHLLLLDEEAQKAGLFLAYLKALAAQTDPLEAARQAFGELGEFEKRLMRYAARPSFRFLDAPLKLSLSEGAFTTRPVPEAEALVLRAEVLARTGKAQEAADLLDRAKAQDPALAPVQAALGLAAIRNGEWPEAQRALLAARVAGSTDFRVPLHLAELALQGDFVPPTSGAGPIGWLEEARKLEPEFPDIHMGLARALARNPQEADKAIQAGMTAVKLAPSDVLVRLNFGSVLLSLGREAEAKRLGEQADQMAFEPWERSAVASYQAQLAQFQEYRAAAERAAKQPGPGAEGEGTLPGPGVPMRPQTLKGGGKPLQFWLPDTLSALSAEVRMALLEGRLDDAIQKVKAALPKAKGPYEKPSLRALLKALEARRAGH